MVDFKENENFRDDAVIKYLSILVENKVLEPFLEAFKRYESTIQNVFSTSSCRSTIEKVRAIVLYRDEVMHCLSNVR